MSTVLGIDTSSYTSSAALYDIGMHRLLQKKKPLPVKNGELGLRQSDAVFHHTVRLPEVLRDLFAETERPVKLEAVGVSAYPCRREGSYMPCFLTGVSAASAVAAANSIPLFEFSHQEGHVAAALYSADRLDLLKRRFLAFHLSGGTTEALLVSPNEERIFRTETAAVSLDLKAGQAIDRVGVMLGLGFPAGPELEKLAGDGKLTRKVKACIRGCDCSLSGIENQCKAMRSAGEDPQNIALFCIESILAALDGMTRALLAKYGELPLLFSGGVASNRRLRQYFEAEFNAVFAESAFCSDNAAGIALLTSLKLR